MTVWRAAAMLALAFLPACASAGPVTTPVVPSEAKLYMAVLADAAKNENLGIAYPRTIKPPERLNGPPQSILALLDSASVDLGGLSAQGRELPADVTPRLDPAEAEAFDSNQREFFHSAAARSGDWAAVIRMSSPAYDSVNAALVYYEYVCSGPLCAGGIWIVLKPTGGRWAVAGRRVVWRS